MPLPAEDLGPAARLREVWERYRRPIAVTEAHHGCTRDEQLRWLVEVWNGAQDAARRRAPTSAPSPSGPCSAPWTGTAFSPSATASTSRAPSTCAAPEPRRTALAHAAEVARQDRDASIIRCSTAPAGGSATSASTGRRRGARSACRLVGVAAPAPDHRRHRHPGPRLLAHLCDFRGLDHVLLSRQDMDIADPESVAAGARLPQALGGHQHGRLCARRARPRTSRRPASARTPSAPRCWREACARLGIPLVTFSSDLVFDGALGQALRGERRGQSRPRVYGASKAEAERRVLGGARRALVMRTSAFFGPGIATISSGRSSNTLRPGRRRRGGRRHRVADLCAGSRARGPRIS